jgi:hypothetical protein
MFTAISRTATSELYKNKVKEMKESRDFEYITCADFTYHYSITGRITGMRGPKSFAVAEVKQNVEGHGDDRIMVVTRKPSTGEINLFMLIRPKDGMVDRLNPLYSCSVDSNFKTNRWFGILKASDLVVTQIGPNKFSVRDKSHRILQLKSKVLEITIKNHEETDNSWDGSKLCVLLEQLMKSGSDPDAVSDLKTMAAAPCSIPIAENSTSTTPMI